MKTTTSRAVLASAALLLTAGSLTACSNASETGGSGTGGSAAPAGGDDATIGLLLPDNDNARYASADEPLFRAKVAELLPNAEVLYQNADADAARQQQQAQAMLTQGADVLVIAAQDGTAAAQIVTLAQQQNVPVIAYDRLIDSPDIAGYISFDNEQVGVLQATALTERMAELDAAADAGYLEVNGSPTDPNAAQFKAGAESVLEQSGYTQLDEYDTPDWVPANAQEWAQGAISQVGAENVAGVYAANDSVGAAVASALSGAGVDELPPITGQDASLAGIQNILNGTLYMTVYKAFAPEAEGAAEMAVALAQGEALDLDGTVAVSDGTEIPATLLEPVSVTADNIQDTVVADGLYTADEICTAEYADACAEYGIE